MVEDSQANRPPSPADTLRRAASLIRHDTVFPATAVIKDPAVAWAVADWLERHADDSARNGWAVSPDALTVARAYIGGDA